ncbi:MAG: hypothetical protein KDA24_24940 [Deltaproteobacteria bacterium]|nr:hypothetical protein [Deltaproteobacteria bacterium]
MKRLVLGGLTALLVVVAAVLWLRDAPEEWSVVLLVAEPPSGALLPPPNAPQSTPRLNRLAGAGVRLPLASPTRDLPQWLDLVLGDTPERGVMPAFEQRGWRRVIASEVALPDPIRGRFSAVGDASRGGVVDVTLQTLDDARVTRAQPALVVLVSRPGTSDGWDRTVSRLLDGAAPRLTLSRTLVVVVDRGGRSAMLIAPDRPRELGVTGNMGPEELGAELARWLKLQ